MLLLLLLVTWVRAMKDRRLVDVREVLRGDLIVTAMWISVDAEVDIRR
jgi:hypothetical protein